MTITPAAMLAPARPDCPALIAAAAAAERNLATLFGVGIRCQAAAARPPVITPTAKGQGFVAIRRNDR